MKRTDSDHRVGVAVLGSTGSVGRQALEVIDAHAERFRVVALAARTSSRLFREQAAKYRPAIAAVAKATGPAIAGAGQCVASIAGLTTAAIHPAVDIVLVATSGHDAIGPTMQAIERGKTVALANKETLVCAGEIIMPLVASRGAALRPVDSEHSAIWQALHDAPQQEVRRLIITASGGPFRTTPTRELAGVSAAQALAHPTWKMGAKITVDSATLMNKGLEVIEAHWLFGMPYDQIDVVVHPESVVHSLVEFVDGSLIGQLGVPDMKLPIQYALTYPERLPTLGSRLDLATVGALHFERPDEERFPCLRLARQASIAGGTFPTVLSAADDVAVAAFMDGRITFPDIARIIGETLERHAPPRALSLDSILAADQWARESARQAISSRSA